MTNTLDPALAKDVMRVYCLKKGTPALGLMDVEILRKSHRRATICGTRCR